MTTAVVGGSGIEAIDTAHGTRAPDAGEARTHASGSDPAIVTPIENESDARANARRGSQSTQIGSTGSIRAS
jgi:hypothetical protein